jgi:putative acetyltransferase
VHPRGSARRLSERPENHRGGGNSGIGSALVKVGLAHCKELGAVAVVVLGHPEFYPKFGFSPAERFGLKCEYDVPAEAFMAIELHARALRGASGTVKYHAVFSQL